MPTYDYKCAHCDILEVYFNNYDNRDKQTCSICEKNMDRVYATAPNVRTAKLSKSFLDKTTIGGGRPDSEGYEDLKKVTKLQEDILDVKPGTEEHKSIKDEIKQRSKIKK